MRLRPRAGAFSLEEIRASEGRPSLRQFGRVADAEKLSKAFARLDALRDVISRQTDEFLPPNPYVVEFHAALNVLILAGFDVKEFALTSEHVRPRHAFTDPTFFFASPFEPQV